MFRCHYCRKVCKRRVKRRFCSRRCYARHRQPKPPPTPTVIARRAAKVRADWSEKTEMQRRAVRPIRWTVPASELREA